MSTVNIGTSNNRAAMLSSAAPRSAAEDLVAERRKLILGVAAALFVCIFILRELSVSKQDALSVLYVIPVAILALGLGLRAGLLAAVGASAAVAVWLATRDLPFSIAPLAVRGSILVFVGVIAGWFSDQMRTSSVAAAVENERLLALELEQASLQAEVDRMRRRLGDQLRNASRVIERQEQERRGIARQLHEDAAQAMAAALLTVGLLERGSASELTRAQFDDVRSQVRSSIADLRRIASSLRPVVLDEMGLASALSRIAEVEAESNDRLVTFSTDGLEAGLSRKAEASTYRVIEEILRALGDARSVDVDLSTGQEMVQIVVEAHPLNDDGEGILARDGKGVLAQEHGFALDGSLADEDEQLSQDLFASKLDEQQLRADLLATRARVELIGGSLHVGSLLGDGSRIVAELPLGI